MHSCVYSFSSKKCSHPADIYGNLFAVLRMENYFLYLTEFSVYFWFNSFLLELILTSKASSPCPFQQWHVECGFLVGFPILSLTFTSLNKLRCTACVAVHVSVAISIPFLTSTWKLQKTVVVRWSARVCKLSLRRKRLGLKTKPEDSSSSFQ